VGIAVLSFGENLDPITVSVPVALAIVNVAVFYLRRVRAPLAQQAPS
jgi:hypothetical protein